MKALLLALLCATAAQAQMVDEPTCYSWEGGHKSAGSFSKCGPVWVTAKAKPAPPAPVVTPIPTPQAAPVPLATPVACTPPPKPILKKRHKAKRRVVVPKC